MTGRAAAGRTALLRAIRGGPREGGQKLGGLSRVHPVHYPGVYLYFTGGLSVSWYQGFIQYPDTGGLSVFYRGLSVSPGWTPKFGPPLACTMARGSVGAVRLVAVRSGILRTIATLYASPWLEARMSSDPSPWRPPGPHPSTRSFSFPRLWTARIRFLLSFCLSREAKPQLNHQTKRVVTLRAVRIRIQTEPVNRAFKKIAPVTLNLWPFVTFCDTCDGYKGLVQIKVYIIGGFCGERRI